MTDSTLLEGLTWRRNGRKRIGAAQESVNGGVILLAPGTFASS